MFVRACVCVRETERQKGRERVGGRRVCMCVWVFTCVVMPVEDNLLPSPTQMQLLLCRLLPKRHLLLQNKIQSMRNLLT